MAAKNESRPLVLSFMRQITITLPDWPAGQSPVEIERRLERAFAAHGPLACGHAVLYYRGCVVCRMAARRLLSRVGPCMARRPELGVEDGGEYIARSEETT